MAIATITNKVMAINNFEDMPATTAVNATDGLEVNYKGKRDNSILLVIENVNAAAKTATIKAGELVQGTTDLSVSIPATSKKIVVIESGKFVNKAGKVKITGASADIKVAAIELPF